MKKYVFIAVAIMVSILSASAQKASISWTPKEKSGLTWSSDAISVGDEYLYNVADLKPLTLQKLDKDLKIVASKPLTEINYKERNIAGLKETEIETVVRYGNRTYLIVDLHNLDVKTKEILAFEIKKDLSLGHANLIDSYAYGYDKRNKNSFVTNDKGTALMYYSILYDSSRLNPNIHLKALNEDLGINWSNSYNVPYCRDYINYERLQLSDDGKTLCGTLTLTSLTRKHMIYTPTKAIELPEPEKTDISFMIGCGKILPDGKTMVYAAPYLDASDDEQNKNYAVTGVFIGHFNIETENFEFTKYQKFGASLFNRLDPIGDHAPRYLAKAYYKVNDIALSSKHNVGIMIDRTIYYNSSTGSSNGYYSDNTTELPAEKILYSFTSDYEHKVYGIGQGNGGNPSMVPYYPNTLQYFNDNLVALYYSAVFKKNRFCASVMDSKGSVQNIELNEDPELHVMNWVYHLLRYENGVLYISGKSGLNRKVGVLKVN